MAHRLDAMLEGPSTLAKDSEVDSIERLLMEAPDGTYRQIEPVWAKEKTCQASSLPGYTVR